MRLNGNMVKVLLVLLAVIVIPSLVYVSLSASSMAAGILVACFIMVLTAGKLRLPLSFIDLPLLFFIALFVIHTAYYGVQGGLSLKHVLSVALFGLMLFCAGLFSVKITAMQDGDLIAVLNKLSVVIIFFGLASIILPVSFLNYDKYVKSIFPFSEPSHYAITISGILLATGFYLSSAMRAGLVLSVLLFSVVYPSMLLLLLALIMIFSYYMCDFLKLSFSFFCLTVLIILIPYIGPYVGVDISYYEDRLRFDESASNLTALVYLQGWEDAYQALLQTNWVGLGFQNMGSLDPGGYGERIFQIVGVYKNREDGGFLAAKIIGEFGALGLVFLLCYIIALCLSILHNRKFFRAYQANRERALELYPVSSVLGCSLIVAFSIEVFARGYGYFSPGILLAMVAIFLVGKKRKQFSSKYGVGYA